MTPCITSPVVRRGQYEDGDHGVQSGRYAGQADEEVQAFLVRPERVNRFDHLIEQHLDRLSSASRKDAEYGVFFQRGETK